MRLQTDEEITRLGTIRIQKRLITPMAGFPNVRFALAPRSVRHDDFASPRGRGLSVVRLAVLVVFLAASLLRSADARDVFVLISGGGSPFENNYSQYLQARALVGYFLDNYRRDSVWVFFGAGNVEGKTPVLGDVYRQTKHDGLLVDSWVPGQLRQNLPARHEVILRAFREEILPAVAEGGTLYLFVGDHGSRSRGRNPESIITLWGLRPDAEGEHGWGYDDDESLGVWELRRTLARGIGKGRVVFCMTQCHAGGFHYLAIPHEVTPNPNWFTQVPAWAEPKEQPAFPAAAGFTATDEFSLASGCNPDPDPANWAGYERFVPESLMGIDLLTLNHTHAALTSFADAHLAATLTDHTTDKPYSTSEQYLERWAHLIETRLAKSPNLVGKARKAVAAYQVATDGARITASDPALHDRQTTFRRFVENLGQQDPNLRKLLLTGTRKQLEHIIAPSTEADDSGNEALDVTAQVIAPDPRQTPPNRSRRGAGAGERRRLWNEVVRPAWQSAIDAKQATGLPAGAEEFEKYLLANEARGSNYFAGGGRALQQEMYWHSGYSNPKHLDAAKAEAMALWAAERRAKILAWAKKSGDETVRAAAERLSQRRGRRQTQDNPMPADHQHPSIEGIDESTAAERTLFYRRTLAAWQFLLTMNERPALTRIHELTALERTPLPPPNRDSAAR